VIWTHLWGGAEPGNALQPSETVEDFTRKMTTSPTEELLQSAMVELWRCGHLYRYRYRKLRIAMRWLLGALVVFLVAVAATGIARFT
jgi:hypothetical protein